MKICHYDSNQAGAVVGDQVYPIGAALMKAGHVRSGYTMLEVIEALCECCECFASLCPTDRVGEMELHVKAES